MYLGLDLGTSGLKGLLIDDDQTPVASAHAPLHVSRPRPGWSEQAPADWIQAATAVLDNLHAHHPDALSAVRGIGLAGHMHGATVIGADDQPLRPCILWNDTRSAQEAAELDADPAFRARSGNIVFPGFTAPKLCWLQRHEPTQFDATRTVLLPKDYLRLWLTGERISEPSDAAGTGWLNTGARSWSDELLAACNLSRDHMPTLVEGSAASGRLRAGLAKRWGMHPAIVAGGGSDNAASAIGLGAIANGAALLSLGTSGVVFTATADYRPAPASAVHTFCHAVPDTWHQMGVMLNAAGALAWYARSVDATPVALIEHLGKRLTGPGSALFLPYLTGERTPHNHAAVRGAFLGLDPSHDRQALTQAVLEGVAYALRDNVAALQQAGTDPAAFTAVGGGSHSRYWLTLIATVLNRPLHIPAHRDLGAAFGAARLGLLAHTNAAPADVCYPPASHTTIEPATDLLTAYDAAYRRFQRAYPMVAALADEAC